MSNIFFGNFVDRNSFVHSLDARMKIFYVVILSSLVFSIKTILDILIFLGIILIIIFISKISVNFILKNLRRFYSIFFFIFFMYVVFSSNKLIEGIIVLWRFLMLILISLILTYTTSLSDLTVAIEKLSKPLKVFGIKPRNIAIMISIAIRFIPVMFLRFERLREGMSARLADFRKLKTIKIVIISLLEKMFLTAANLSEAMSARLYNEDVGSLKIMQLRQNDYISMIVFFIFVIILTTSRFWYNWLYGNS